MNGARVRTGTWAAVVPSAVGGVALVAGLSGCGSSSESAGPTSVQVAPVDSVSPTPAGQSPTAPGPSSMSPGPKTTTPGPNAGVRACGPADVVAGTGQGSAAAGSILYAIDITNHGNTACTVDGAPAIAFVTGPHGTEIGPRAVTDSKPGTPFVLQPGQSASVGLTIVNVVNYPAERCHESAVAGMRVWLPGAGAEQSLYLPLSTHTCAQPGPGVTVARVTAFGPSGA